MDKFNFMNVANALNNSLETGVSFEGRSMKWETAEDVKSLIEEIDNCKSLIYMNLDGNTLGVEAAARIGEALKKHPEFKKALWKNLFTGRLKEEIPKALESLGQGLIAAGACLTVFDCSDNALGPNGMSGLVNLLSSAACFSLQELRLNNCGLGIAGSRMLANALFKCYEKSCGEGRPLQLRVFVAGRNRLENEGAKALAKVFAAVKTLEEVVIPQNGIYHEGIAALSEAFRENENMQVLDLADNTIKPKGAAALASVLHCMPKLREIHFADALLKTKGAMILGDALQDNHTQLEVLNLGFNEIRSDGGYAILTALQNKTKLKSVQLNGNALGEKCCLQLLELIHSNPQATGSFSEDEGDEASDDEDENTNENVEDDEDEETEDEDDENYGASDEENYTGGEIDEEEAEGFNYVTALNGKSFETTYDESFNSNSSVYYAGEESRPNTVETFFNTPNPSLTLFNSLEEGDKLEAMRNLLKRYKDDDYLIALVFTTLKCAALAKESQEALDMAVSLFQDTFDYAESTRQIARVKNFILIQLGLLKSEDKKFRPTYNLQSCRFALQETITKHTVPEDVKKTFELFLERFA